MLTEQEKNRYARQIILPGMGEEGQRRLKEAKVLIVGAGGLGCPLALYLCAAGVGSLTIIDDDRVDESNLQRQVLYTTEDVGRYKVEVAAERLGKLNPAVEINTCASRLDRENGEELIRNHDLVLDGCDNLPTRYLLNDFCVKLNKVYIYGAICEYSGQLSVFNYRGGPTYRCLYPDEKNAKASSRLGVMGVLPGVVANLQAMEAIKIISGVGEPLSGFLMMIDLLTGGFEKIALSRSSFAGKITV